MESMRKRLKMKLVSCTKILQKLVNKPAFKHCTNYDKNLSAVKLNSND